MRNRGRAEVGFLQDLSEANRVKGGTLANAICKESGGHAIIRTRKKEV